MSTRHTITIGPKTGKIVQDILRRFRKETQTEWTFPEILEAAVANGLPLVAEKALLKKHSAMSCRL